MKDKNLCLARKHSRMMNISNKSRRTKYLFIRHIILLLGLVAFSFPLQGQIINRLTVDRFTHYRVDDWISYANALKINSVDIDEDYIYFASQQGGILRYDKYQNFWDFPYTTSSGLRSNTVLQIVYNPDDGILYARSSKGIDELRYADHFWRPSEIRAMPQRRAPRLKEIASLRRKKDFRFPVFYRPPNKFLPDFFTDISLSYHLDGTIIDQFTREFHLTDRVTDQWQRIWFGSDGMGPLKADLFTFNLESLPQSIPAISPRDVLITGAFVWVGGIRQKGPVGGITRWNRETDAWDYFEAPFISRLYKDDVNAISSNEKYTVFATDYGVATYNMRKGNWRMRSVQDGMESDRVFDVLAVDSVIYAGTERGFNWIDLPNMNVYELRKTTLDNVRINQLADDGEFIWLATQYGLYRFNPQNEQLTFYPTQAAAQDQFLKAIEIIGDEIWMANRSGILVFNPVKNSWKSFSALQRKFNFHDILATEKAVWFATDQGLLKYDRKNNYWRLFTEEDGLLANRVFHIDREEDRLWLSTEKGVTLFRYDRSGRID